MTADIITHAAHDPHGHTPPGHRPGYTLTCPDCRAATQARLDAAQAESRRLVRQAVWAFRQFVILSWLAVATPAVVVIAALWPIR